MSGIIYKENHTIPNFLCDRNGKLTLPMLVNFLIQASSNQNKQLNIDNKQFEKNGYNWIVLQYEFHINRMPKEKEDISITTDPKEYNKLFTYRDFFVDDEEGNRIIEVHSTFALMDMKKRKIMRLPKEVIDPYKADASKRIRRTPQPGTITEEKAQTSKKYRVRYFDIDSNQHVNNSHYFNWLLDALDSEFLTNHQIFYGNIKFDKEIHENEVVHSYVNVEKNGDEIISKHKIKVGDKSNCIAEFKWEPTNI